MLFAGVSYGATYTLFHLWVQSSVGDNAVSLEQAAGMRASLGLHRHNRHLRRLFYLSLRAPPLPPSLNGSLVI